MLGFDNHNGSEPVGYFPSKTVGELRTGAEKVKFGGYIYSKRGDYTSPPMGSRYFSRPPKYDQTCFMIQVAVILPEFQLTVPPDLVQTAESRCYFEGDHSLKAGKEAYTFILADLVAPRIAVHLHQHKIISKNMFIDCTYAIELL